MAIPNKARGVRMSAAYLLARTFIWLLGLGAVAWGGFVLPLFWQQAPLIGLPRSSFRAAPSKCKRF